MKIDLYTKSILTVIAVCLLWISINGVTPAVRAQAARAQPTPVVLVDEKGTPLQALPVTLGQQAIPVLVSNPQPLPVAVAGNTTVAVAVRSIERSGRWDPLQVQVLRDPPTLRPTP